MKITKRKLRRIIREAIKGHVHQDPSKEAFLDITMTAMQKSDYVSAADAIMDSYWVDDVWPEVEQVLVDMLTALPTGASSGEVEAVADEWIQGYNAGKWNPIKQGKLAPGPRRAQTPEQYSKRYPQFAKGADK